MTDEVEKAGKTSEGQDPADSIETRVLETDGDPAQVSERASSGLGEGVVINGRYSVVGLLGKGGMGEVYLADDTKINRKVALKVLHSDRVSNDESIKRFSQEAQAVSALNHPHIMTVYEIESTEDGTLFFVAEFVDGQTLNHLIARGIAIETALDIAIQTLSALSAAHAAGLVHRDIKPENIMIRRDGYVKVLDFGLAKLGQQETHHLSPGSEDPTQALLRTRPGTVMGTAAYMSPEQARGLQIDGRSDLWSVGVVLYEMISGKRPFAGDTAADLIVSILSGEPPELTSAMRGVPGEVEQIVAKALSKKVEDRYQTADGFRSDLEYAKRQLQLNINNQRTAEHSGLDARQHETDGKDRKIGDGLATAVALDAMPTHGGPANTSGGTKEGTNGEVVASTVEPRSRMLRWALITVVLIAAGTLIGYFVFLPARSGPSIESIAVLPLENLTGDQNFEYVSEGISERLIDRLAQLPQIKVISRSSSFKLRGESADPKAAASKLGVTTIVTGSLRKLGDSLEVSIEIIDAGEDRRLAGGTYRRSASDVLGIQKEIAQTTAEQLRLKLTNEQSKRFLDTGTSNAEAYRYYLNGLVELNGPMDVRGNALEYFERAASIDPDFADAYAQIAWIYWARANGSDDPTELVPKAKAAAERAVALGPDLSKGHVIQAMIGEYEFDWKTAEREYTKAIELSPNDDFARNNYAFFLSVMGRQDDALAQLEEQRLRDPINRRMWLLQRGIILTQSRRFDDALAAYTEAQAIEPTREIPNFSLGYVYAGKGMYSEAAVYYKRAVDALGGENKYSQPLVYLAAAYAKTPARQPESRQILSRVESTEQYTSPAIMAVGYAALGDDPKAIELLEKAYIEHDPLLRFIATGYEYDSLRGDSRFIQLVKRIGLE